jgi:predicted phosphodiesterase
MLWPSGVRAVLITGHTHEFKAYKYEDRLFINPVRAYDRRTAPDAATVFWRERARKRLIAC